MPDPIGELPRGYLVHRVADAWLVLDRESWAPLVALGLADPAVRRTLFSRAPRRGRGASPTVQLGTAGAVVLRSYRHGGLFGWLTGPLLVGPGRALSELRVTARAEAAGAPVPHVLCAVAWPVIGPLWSALLGTRDESSARDLVTALDGLGSPRAVRALAREVGSAIRRLHDAGVEHRDLQLRNILLVENGESRRIVVVDLDRAVFHPMRSLDARRRARNLGRLVRSAVKLGVPRGAGRRELAALVAGYTAGDRELRAELRRWAAWERLKVGAHRWSYAVRFGAADPSRKSPRSASPPRRA